MRIPYYGIFFGKLSAINLKELQIVFNQPVDKTTAEEEANFKAFNGGATTDLVAGGTATLQADGKTVIITLGGNFNNGTSGKVTVKNVKSAAGAVIADYTNESVAASDSTVPSIVGIAVSGPQTITAEYSEPITALSPEEYTVDDGNYIVTDAKANGSKKVDILVGVNLTVGEHKIKFKGTNVADYAGYKVIPLTKTFTFADDKTAPTVSVKSASPTQVKLVFSKPVKNIQDANVLYRHTYNSSTFEYTGDAQIAGAKEGEKVAWITAASSTEYTLNFSEKVIPLGSNKLYIAYSSSTGTKIQDLWGNKLEATTLDLNINLDTTKPDVKEVKFVDSKTIKVIFSEAVDQTSAETTSNYTVKDSAGKAVTVLTAVRGGTDNNEVTLGFNDDAINGGSFTITVKGIKDTAFVKNAMDEYTTTMTINDTVKPKVNSAYYSISVDGTTAKVYIPFSERMDATKLVKANFLKKINAEDFKALSDDDSITVADDAKSVTLTLKGTAIASVAIKVGALSDAAGNGFQSIIYESTTADPAPAGQFAITKDSVTIESVKAIDKTTIKATFSGRLSTVSAVGYTLVDSTNNSISSLSVTNHDINSDNKSVVTFSLGSSLAEDAKVGGNAITLKLDTDKTNTKTYLGTKLESQSMDVKDAIAPTVNSVKLAADTTEIVDGKEVTYNNIEITLNEALKASTFAVTLNGFSVKDGKDNLTLKTVTLKDGGKTIVLKGKGFIKDVTSVSYNSVAGLTDLAGNAIATFADKVCK